MKPLAHDDQLTVIPNHADSYAIYDALLQTSSTPWLEVHLGNMYAKEDFRKSVLAPLCSGIIVGCGPLGYEMAMLRAKELIQERKK